MELRMSAVKPEKVPNLPPSHFVDTRIYTDAGIFEEERFKIFGKVWNFVCHESEIASAGCFRTATVAGYPLVVVRQNDGGIKGFYNICRHRQAQVVRACSGQVKSFQCFYHLWTYGIDGRLVGVTLPEGYAGTGFDKADYGLREVRVEMVAGMVFVCLSEETEPLREFLGEVAPVLEKYAPPEGFEVFHFHQAEIKTNWKLFFENNSERYHTALHWAHRSRGNWGRPGGPSDGWTFVPNGHNYTPFNKGKNMGNARNVGLQDRKQFTLPGHDGHFSSSHHLFPDLLLVTISTVLRIDHLIPVSPGRTLVEWRGVGVKGEPPEVRALRIKHHNEFWGYSGANLAEDIAAAESQWPMMATGGVRYSIVAREGESFSDEALRHYYKEWGRLMGRTYWDPFGESADPR
jgi:phenylpropionate dioxygenase-like ring-hydroxylating dioxygenase large terminal subunit